MIDEKNIDPDDAVDEDPEYQEDLPDPDVHLDAEPDTDIPDDEGDSPDPDVERITKANGGS